MVKTYTKSKSGMYRVTLSATHEHADFLYKPAAAGITVNQVILDDMIAAGKVTNVAAD